MFLKNSSADNWLVLDKPEGITTHRSDMDQWGLIEYAQDILKQNLFVVHRLDKDTSGALLVAKTSPCAKELAELFKNHRVEKKYIFLTDRKVHFDEVTHKSHIEKLGPNEFCSHQKEEVNSETAFQKIWSHSGFTLWMAQPKTGRSHQIRLHAADLGIPLLGDQLYGGSPWIRLALHASELSFSLNETPHQVSSPSPWWSNPESLTSEAHPDLSWPLLTAFEKRKRWGFSIGSTDQSFRLLQEETELFSVDQLGPLWWVYWYGDHPCSKKQIQFFENFQKQHQVPLCIRWMKNRGKDPQTNDLIKLGSPPSNWELIENNLKFLMKSDAGLSPGLFLDQRNNRQWVFEQSKGKKVLNLFAYTCGFSLAAALGGAEQVCSVDVSKKFIEWGKENFVLNNLDPQKFEFWVQDVLLFLKGTAKRKRQFDLIILDPPSFGRSNEGVFNFSKDWEKLLLDCKSVLSENGKILFSSNFEKWNSFEFDHHVLGWAQKNNFASLPLPAPGADFELTKKRRKLKALALQII